MVGRSQYVLDATTRLGALRARPELGRYRAPELIKAGRRGSVFSAWDRERRVLVKLHYGQAGVDEAKAAANALARVEAWMDSGANRVPLLLDHLEDDGVIVTEFAPGERLDRLIATHPDDRAAFITRSAEWLLALSGPPRLREAFQGRFWVRSRASALEGLVGDDADLAAALMSEVARCRDALAGREMAKYYAHGDWAPHNMIFDGETVFGVDIAVKKPILRAKDLARFLVYLVAHVPGPPPLEHGIPVADLRALAAVPEAQDDVLMRFFIGVELADKFARNHDQGAVAARVRAAICAYLA